MTRSFLYTQRRCLRILLSLLIAAVFFGASGLAVPAGATDAQKVFASPGEAVEALVAAVRANDTAGMMAILGPGSRALIFSGDDAADRVGRQRFIAAFDRMNTLQQGPEESLVLCVGDESWPLPIPLVKAGDTWSFDSQKGREEILNRRVGRNELRVMEVLHAYVDAQQEYASRDCRGGGAVEFATRLISSPGKRDGLYWPPGENEEESPFGPLVARAAREGYANPDLSPFHGYYFRILKGQGRHARGGAYDYIVKGRMILGFAIVAFPAEYGNSGVMTFIVNQEGIIYQKDLGRETKKLAEKMKLFDPDETWRQAEQTAGAD